MSDQTVRSRRGLLWVGGLLIPVFTALLLGAGNEDSAQLSQNRLEIEQMTPAQRSELQWSYEEFRKMPIAEQQRYRELHRQLQTDDNAVTLRVTLDRYRSWLETLSPFEREELRAIDDVDQRVERVRELMRQQSTPDSPSKEHPRLTREDLASLIKVIADELSLSSADIEGESEWQQHMFVLNRLVESRREQFRLHDWNPLFDDAMIETMTSALPEGEFRDAMRDAPSTNEKQRLVARSIQDVLGRALRDQLVNYRPTSKEMQASSLRMSPQERRRYEELETKAEKNFFHLSRLRMKRLYSIMEPYPALRPVLYREVRERRGHQPPPRRFPGRGDRESDPRGPETKRRPPGPPRGFRPGEKRRRFDERRPPEGPGE